MFIGINAIACVFVSASLLLVAMVGVLSGWLTRTLSCLGVNVVVTRLFYLTRTMARLFGLLNLLLKLSDLNLLNSCLIALRLGVQEPLLSSQVLMRIRRVGELLVNCFLSLCVTAKAGEMTGLLTLSFVLNFRVNAAPLVLSGLDSNSILFLWVSPVKCLFNVRTLLLAVVATATAPSTWYASRGRLA